MEEIETGMRIMENVLINCEGTKKIVKEKDLDFLSESAFNDVCTGGNPRETSSEEIKRLYESLI